jgi:hypothetical protein
MENRWAVLITVCCPDPQLWADWRERRDRLRLLKAL